jgi:hypothetical protein
MIRELDDPKERVADEQILYTAKTSRLNRYFSTLLACVSAELACALRVHGEARDFGSPDYFVPAVILLVALAVLIGAVLLMWPLGREVAEMEVALGIDEAERRLQFEVADVRSVQFWGITGRRTLRYLHRELDRGWPTFRSVLVLPFVVVMAFSLPFWAFVIP